MNNDWNQGTEADLADALAVLKREGLPKAYKRIMELVESNNEHVAFKAASWLAERVEGKAIQPTVAIDAGTGVQAAQEAALELMTTRQLSVLLAAVEREEKAVVV